MATKKIWEESAYIQEGSMFPNMTPEKLARGAFYQKEYYILQGEQANRIAKWEELERLYRAERDITPDAPNSFIPVINPIISGQVAALVEKNVEAAIQGKGVSDSKFSHTLQMIADLMLKEWDIKQRIKEAAKGYLLNGTCVMEMVWEPDEYRSGTGANMGFPYCKYVPLSRFFIDGKIKNLADYQDAEWIIREVGFKSIAWVRRNFGDEVADNVTRLNHNYHFDGDVSYDDINATSILYVWTRNNKEGNLQRIIMDRRGFIFDESDPKTPFYDFVNNKYPFGIAGCYKSEEQFYRFGDGLLLKPMQETINNLFDELVTACKFSAQPRTYIDPQGQADLDQFDSDPSHYIACVNPHQNVYVAPAGGINPVVEKLIAMLMNEAQKATRFSSLMAGNDPGEKMTATQAGIQVNQGNNTINDKRMDIGAMFEFCIKYGLGMLIELWTAAQALRVSDDSEDFEWVDTRQLANVPVLVPADDKFREQWQKAFPNSPSELSPKWMQLHAKDDETGKIEPATKIIDFDVKISLGEGLPTSKIALYNIMLSLAQLQLIDETTGQPSPLIGKAKFKQLAQDILGLNIEDDTQMQNMGINPNMQGQGMAMNGTPRPITANANIPGANVNGNIGGGGMVV